MRDLLILTIHLIVSNRVRLRAPNLTTLDRFLIGQFERESLGPKARVLNRLPP